MSLNEWDTNSIYEVFLSEARIVEGADLTIIRHDIPNQIVIGYARDGSVFLGCKQVGKIAGFSTSRATLKTMQEIENEMLGSIEPAFILTFSVLSEEELLAISTVFSGIYELNLNHSGTSKATEAAQGFEDYFNNFAKMKLSRSTEIGLFGELIFISLATNKELIISGWQTVYNSTYDFSANGSRLEVKTSTRPTRQHWLRDSQTIDSSQKDLFYVSIYAPEDPSGITINDLVEKISATLTPIQKDMLGRKLKSFDLEKCALRFDYSEAINSLRFFAANEVPIPLSEHNSIVALRWKCDFTRIKMAENIDPWKELLD